MMLLAVLCFCCCCLRLPVGVVVSAVDPNGFVSIDCGYSGSAYYNDSSTGLSWTSDSRFFDPAGDNLETGILAVDPPFSSSPNYFRSVRYFTGNRTKYCYVFDEANALVEAGSAYLVRASFWAGQYARTDPLPGTKRNNASLIFFQIYINADTWDDVVIEIGASSPIIKEMYVVANYSSEISVCLGGPGVPGLDSHFISALELRPLDSFMDAVGTMAATSRHLFKLHRIDFGSTSKSPLRYPNDKFDRIWDANSEQPSLSTTALIENDLAENPPLEVLQTARTTAPADIGFNITIGLRGNSLIEGSGSRSYYYFLYMAEISWEVTATGQRVFDIGIFDGHSYDFSVRSYDIMNMTEMKNERFAATGWYSGRNVFWTADTYEQGSLIFTFVKSNGSVFGPLLNGLELLLASDTAASAGTITTDVNALQATKDSFQGGYIRSWLGNPCLPYPYNWISCSKTGRPVIISLLSIFLGGCDLGSSALWFTTL